MGDESALEARLERAHTVIGDLLRSLGEVELLPDRQQVAAREAMAFREQLSIERKFRRALDGQSGDWRNQGVAGDLPEDIKRQVIRDGWAPPIRRLFERVGATGWKDLVAAIEREHNELVELREFSRLCNRQMTELMEALPPGDEQVAVAQRVAQLVREHGEMVAEMMKEADPEDIADAAATLAEPQPVPAAELGAIDFIDLVFESASIDATCRNAFVRVEDHRGHNIKIGEWLDRGDGMWALRIPVRCHPLMSRAPRCGIGWLVDGKFEFVVEDHHGHALTGGEWLDRPDGTWALRLPMQQPAEALSALTAVVATSAMDWRRSPCLAWVYGVLVGHDRDVLEDLQLVFNWPDWTVDEIDRHRRALLAARGG